MTRKRRNSLIEKHIVIVDRIVGQALRGGFPPYVESDDLKQEGYLALLKAVSGYRKSNTCSFEARIARRVMDAVIAFIVNEGKHWENREDWEDLFDSKGEPKL